MAMPDEEDEQWPSRDDSAPSAARRGSPRRPASAAASASRGTRLIFVPRSRRSAGVRVIEARTQTSGISIPPRPIERMNGSGRISMLTRPIATVVPETITDRPACCIVSTIASSTVKPFAISSRKRKIIRSE